MKGHFLHTIFMLLLGHFLGPVSTAQDDFRSVPVEVIGLSTDRSIYISGENIRFSATVITKNKSLSRVLYVEIISQKNDQILGQKFLVSDAVSSGRINIPRELPTGIYYLKSYTKCMRNYGPGSFSYNKIRVLNPFEGSIHIENPELTDPETGTFLTFAADEYNLFGIQTDRAVYKAQDSILIKIIPKFHLDSLRSACISVVPSYSGKPEIIFNIGMEKQTRKNDYMPEYYGVSLTGLLLDKNSNLPLPSTKLELSILGDSSDLISVYTDPAGRFYFPLPDLTGEKTVFIGTEENDTIAASIMIDNDFSPLSIDLPYQSFNLSDDEKSTALNLARNLQISEHYSGPSDSLANKPSNHGDRPFYGTPTEILNIDDYINLPTLEDYFNELPYLVKVRKLQGKKYLKITGSVSGIQIYKPLVLMDMISVYDIDAILSVSSKQISHIDIINETYVKGNITYGGIVSIFSKNNDFAGIDLPRSGIFIKYDFLSGSLPEDGDPGDGHFPDVRNTLFWDGNLRFKNDAPEEIFFLAGPSRGQYDIVLQGILKNGERFTQIATFSVE
jgi:hypothetical protein